MSTTAVAAPTARLNQATGSYRNSETRPTARTFARTFPGVTGAGVMALATR